MKEIYLKTNIGDPADLSEPQIVQRFRPDTRIKYNKTTKQGVMIGLLFTIMALLIPQTYAAYTCSLSLTSANVNAQTSYKITYFPSVQSNTALKGASITLKFPVSTGIKVVGSSCSVTGTSTNFASPACTIPTADSSYNYVKVGPFSSTATYGLYVTTVTSILNAFSAQSVSTIMCSITNGASTIDSGALTSVLSFNANQVATTDVSMSTSPTTNGATAVFTATMKLSDDITSNGYISISFPKQNYYYSAAGNGGTDIGGGIVSATDVLPTTTTISEVTVNYYPVSTPTVKVNIPISTVTVASNVDNLLAVKLNSASSSSFTLGVVPKLGTIEIIVTGVINPPSTRQFLNLFSIYTSDANKNSINILPSASLTATTVAAFTQGTSSITANTGVLETDAEYTFQFKLTNPIPKGAYLTMVIPSTVSVPGTLTVDCYSGCQGSTTASLTSTLTYKIDSIFTVDYAAKDSNIYMIITGFTNPASKTAASFTFTSIDNSGGGVHLIDTISSLTITAVKGTISVTSVWPTDSFKIYDVPASYTIILIPEHAVATTYQLIITFPSEFKVLAGSCSVTGLNSGYTCTGSSSANTITISNFVSTAGTAGTTYTFKVSNIKNPGTYSETNSITFQLATASGGVIDEGSTTIPSYTFVSTTIESFSVYPSSYLAGASGVSYTFTVRPRARVIQNAYMILQLPTDLAIPKQSPIEISCGSTLSGFPYTKIYCQVDLSKFQITIKQGFQNSDSAGDPPTLIFSIPAITNPRSTKTTSTFNITIYDSSSRALYYYNYTSSPTVTMTGATTPTYIKYTRSNPANGALTSYEWTVRTTTYYVDGDVITITVPSSSSIAFTSNTNCIGISPLATSLTCTLSTDLSYISVKVKTSFRRRLGTIDIGDTLALTLTNVYNPPTFRPTTNSFAYSVRTSDGYLMESQSSGLTVTNTIAGTLNIYNAGVLPQSFTFATKTNYSVSFVPLNYEQNMKIIVTVPSQVILPTNGAVYCYGSTGTDQLLLTCTTNLITRTITITNAVTNQRVSPYNITFLIGPLQNPSDKVVTDSFKIQTYSYDNYVIDALLTNLTVNFYCNYPCKSCDNSKTAYCYSCYSVVTEKLFFDNQCLQTCPSSTYELTSNNSCVACTYPCAECSGNSTSCTKCVSGYTLVGNQCYQISFYPWPFVALGFLLILFVLLCILCKKETKFRESAVALVAWPEIFSWVAYTLLQWYYNKYTLQFFLAVGAVGAHLILNVIYVIIHQKVIVPSHASTQYKKFVEVNHKCNATVLFFSFFFTFKFHHLTLSQMGNSKKLMGKFNQRSWCDWNIFAITYIIISYGAMMASCALYIFYNHSNFSSVLQFLTCEVLFLSTFVTFLLLVGMCQNCQCGSRVKKSKAESYNKVKHDQSSNLDSSSSVTLVRKRNYHKRIYNEELIDDIEVGKSKKKNRVMKTQDPDFSDEDEEFYARNKRRETDVNAKRSARKNDDRYAEEIDLLQRMTMQLRNEEHLMNMEKRLILQERERLLREREDRMFELESIKTEMGKDRDQIKREQLKLQEQRENFLNEVDNRIQQKLESWEQQSIKSSSTLNQKLQMGGNHSTKQIQTNKRMHEVDFNVSVGFEAATETTQGGTKGLDNKSKFFKNNSAQKVIKEEMYESDDMERILDKADEVIKYQEEMKSKTISISHVKKPFFERINDIVNKEDKPQVFIKLPDPIFEKISDNKDEIQQQTIQLTQRPGAFFTNEDSSQSAAPNTRAEYNLSKVVDAPSAHYRDNLLESNYEKSIVTSKPVTPQTGFYSKPDEFKPYNQDIEMEQLPVFPEAFISNEILSQEKEEETVSLWDRPHALFKKRRKEPIIEREENIEVQMQVVPAYLDRTAGNGFKQAEEWIENRSSLPDPHFQPRATNHERFREGDEEQFLDKDNAVTGTVTEDERFREADLAYIQNQDPINSVVDRSQIDREHDEAYVPLPNDDNAQGRATTSDNRRSKEHMESYINDHQRPHNSTLNYEREDNMEMRTQLAQDESLDEISMTEQPKHIEAEDLDKDRDFAKNNKRKVIYSDKSESSIDEMMEDTPSNYNIPNGRLDGKSQGIKGILLQAQKQKHLNTVSLSPRNRFEKDPKVVNKISSTPKDGNSLIQNRLANQQRLHPDEEKKFVNNLFRETPVPGQFNQQQVIGTGGAKHLKMPPQQNRNQSLVKQQQRQYAMQSAQDSGNEQSWRAFNQPIRQMEVLDDTMNSLGNDQPFLDNSNNTVAQEQFDMRQKKKKKKVAGNKQFKEPNPNMERIKALEQAYMMKQPGQITTNTTNFQKQGSFKVGQNTPQEQYNNGSMMRLQDDEQSVLNNFETQRNPNDNNRVINKKTNNYF